jgi:hypothetical protein
VGNELDRDMEGDGRTVSCSRCVIRARDVVTVRILNEEGHYVTA